jgi:hypothetical protein
MKFSSFYFEEIEDKYFDEKLSISTSTKSSAQVADFNVEIFAKKTTNRSFAVFNNKLVFLIMYNNNIP